MPTFSAIWEGGLPECSPSGRASAVLTSERRRQLAARAFDVQPEVDQVPAGVLDDVSWETITPTSDALERRAVAASQSSRRSPTTAEPLLGVPGLQQ
jgi:hypothetical protein